MARKKVRVKSGVIAVTFQIIQHAKTHDLSGKPDQDASRRKRGDIIEFVRTDRFATFDDSANEWRWDSPILSPNMVLIHARGFPQARFGKAKRRFTEDLTVNNIGRQDETDEAESARRSRWRVAYDDLPPSVKAALNTSKEATMRWDAGANPLRPLIKKKTFTDRHDPDSDDETEVSEDDIPEDIAP